jgi:hypothetical protein
VLVLQRGGRAVHRMQSLRVCFYVPRGRREIHYFWDGEPHEVRGPDGKSSRG